MKRLRTHSDLLRSFSAAIIVMFSLNCTKTVHDRRPTATNSPESREYFGFVLNGRYFISEERRGNVSGDCSYADTYNTASVFRINSNHSAPNCVGGTIEIILDSVNIKEGNRYVLGTPGRKKNFLTCSFVSECSKPAVQLATKDGLFGYIKITKYRPDINVMSGVFSCIVTNDDGISYQIADGYFDRHYSRF